MIDFPADGADYRLRGNFFISGIEDEYQIDDPSKRNTIQRTAYNGKLSEDDYVELKMVLTMDELNDMFKLPPDKKDDSSEDFESGRPGKMKGMQMFDFFRGR